MRRVVIWTLNDAAMLLNGAEHEIIKLFRKRGIECRFANRRKYNNKQRLRESVDLENSAKKEPHNLMFEQDIRFNEYFVPIPIKCIGGLFQQENEYPELSPIRALYSPPSAGGDRPEYQEYWDPGVAQERFPDTRFTRMLTNPCQGYYDIIDQEADADEQTILIGYSQGGLVARYLAFLDEYVFKKNRIHSVVTIAASNYGSPFANPDNKDAIAQALQPVLRPLFQHIGSLPAPWAKSIRQSAVITKTRVIFEEVLDDLDKFITQRSKPSTRNELLDLRKWLGGLDGDRRNAFWDLNIKRHAEKHTVLADVNLRPLQRIHTCSLCSGGNDITTLMRSALFMAGSIPGYFAALFINHRNIFGNLKQLTEHYKQHVMNEVAPEKLPEIGRERFEYFRTGMQKGLPQHNERDHDFVIPAAYQVLSNPEPFHSRTIREADHNSMRQRGGVGKKAYRILIKEILPAIADRIS